MRITRLVGALIAFAMLPLAQAATGDAEMIGSWKYSAEKHGISRSMIGTNVRIEQTGPLWTIALSYGPRLITVFKCAGDGSACTIEEDKREKLACKANWEGKKLLADCTWINGSRNTSIEPWVFLIQDGMLSISRSGRVHWFNKL